MTTSTAMHEVRERRQTGVLRLLGKAESINVRKVLWTLAELALPYEREDWGSGYRDTRDPVFFALNPNAMVPVLVDGDHVLWESNSICRYLAGRAGRDDLLPAAPRARAVVEQWMDWQATELNTSWRYAFLSLVRGSQAHRDPGLLDASVSAWNDNMRLLDRRLAYTGAYVAGDTFTLADIVLALSINRWRQTPMAHPVLPAIDAYCARLAGRRGYAEHVDNGIA